MTAAGRTGRRVIGESGLVLGSPCAQGSRRLGGAGPLSRGTTGGGGGGRGRGHCSVSGSGPPQGSAGIWGADRQQSHTRYIRRGPLVSSKLSICGKSQANSNPTVWSALRPLSGAGPPTLTSTGPPPSPPTGGRTPKVPSQPGSGGCSGTSSQSAEWNQGCGGQERKELLLLRFLLVLFKAVVIHWKCQGDSIFSRLPRRRGHGQIAGSTPAPHTRAWKTSTFSRYSWWNRLARQWKGAS